MHNVQLSAKGLRFSRRLSLLLLLIVVATSAVAQSQPPSPGALGSVKGSVTVLPAAPALYLART